MLHTHFIGKIIGVRPTRRTNSTTKAITENVEVTIQQEIYDNDKYPVISTESVTYPIDMFQAFKSNTGKYICIAYQYLNTPKGNFFFADNSIPFVVLDNDPLTGVASKPIK